MKLHIKSLRAETVLGIYHHEKHAPREVILHLKLTIRPPAEDRIGATVDYDKVAQTLRDYLKNNQVELIETLAERVLDQLAAFPHIEAAELEIEKPGAVKDAVVSVVTERVYKK